MLGAQGGNFGCDVYAFLPVFVCISMRVFVYVCVLRYLKAVFHESTLTDGFFQEPQSLCQVRLPPPQGAEKAHDSTTSKQTVHQPN